MNKTVLSAFLVVGALVLAFVLWQLVFTDGGVFRTSYNAVARAINTQYAKTAAGAELLPEWSLSNTAPLGTGFDAMALN